MLQLRILAAVAVLPLAMQVSGAQESADPESATSIVVDFVTGDAIALRRLDHNEASIDIDGHLGEPFWGALLAIDAYKVLEPDTLEDPVYRTQMRLFYTDRGIYVSFEMEQPHDTLVRRHAPRDSFDVNRDTIGINIDSSGSGRYGYWMTLALGDGQMDGTVLPERQYSREWDGVWYGATQLTETGWSAEFFVPWGQMAMPKQQGIRHIAIYSSRKVAHLNQRWGWPGLPRSVPRFMSLWQPLELEGVDPRQQWSMFPYVSSTLDRVVDESQYKAGVDLFWRPSSNFQGTATLNPDFGAVESDDVVVNLTADEVFFPEKRLFFQEGSEIFETTPRANEGNRNKFTIVNTRRVGGSAREPDLPPGVGLAGREELTLADILGATKATGQFGGIRYGFLAAVEDETSFIADDSNQYIQDGRNFGTVRIIYEDSHNAAYRGLGLISSLVAHPEADAFVNAVDFHYLTRSGAWRFDGQLVQSNRDETGIGYGGTLDITYAPRQGIRHTAKFTDFDSMLDVNDFGFQRRNDDRFVTYQLEWIKSGLTRIRDSRLSPFVEYGENGEGLTTSNGFGSGYHFNLNNNDQISGIAEFFPGRYEDRNSFGNGTYKIKDRVGFEFNYTTDTSRPVSVRASTGWEGGDLYSGDFALTGQITWQPRDNLGINLEVTHKNVGGWLLHAGGKNFTSYKGERWEPEFSLEFYPTARQQFRIALQWVGIQATEDRFYVLPNNSFDLVEVDTPPPDSNSGDFGISSLNFQIRYRWQIAPLSDLFIVYTKADSHRTELSDFGDLFRQSWQAPLGDQLIIKLRYRLGS